MIAERLAETAARVKASEEFSFHPIPPIVSRTEPTLRANPGRQDAPSRSLATMRQPSQADTDADILGLWLHGRPDATQTAYRRHSMAFLAFVQKPLRHVTLGDVQQFHDSLADLSPNSQLTIVRVVKSLFSFAFRLGYLPFNVGAVIRLPKADDCLHERYLSEAEVNAMLGMESDPRNHAIIRLLYGGGLRSSELCGCKWRDLQPKGNSGMVTVLGKGSKHRAVLLSPAIWDELQSIRKGAGPDSPVFTTYIPWKSVHHGGHITPHCVWQVVTDAAMQAGISKPVSPHWLRHAHISHALDGGAPLHVVQATVGHVNMSTTGRYAHARPNDSSSNYLPETVAYEPDPRPFFDGASIGRARRAIGLSTRQLATELGMSKTYLVSLEAGMYQPSEETANKLLTWMEQASA